MVTALSPGFHFYITKKLKFSGFLLCFHVFDVYWVIYSGYKIFILVICSLFYQIFHLTAMNFLVLIFFFIVHVLVAPSLGIQDENWIRIFMPKNKVTNTISAKPTVNKTVNKTRMVFISTKMVANGQTFFENCWFIFLMITLHRHAT